MALPYPISPSQTAAGAPIDQLLMDSIRLDLEFLDGKSGGGGAGGGGGVSFRVNGNMRYLNLNGGNFRLDGTVVSSDLTLSQAILYCDRTGTGGTLEVDAGLYANYSVTISSIVAGGGGAEKIINFSADQSLNAVVGDYVIITGVNSYSDKFQYKITEINRGGAGNYNFIVEDIGSKLTAGGAPGKWTAKFSSIFSVRPTLTNINSSAVKSSNGVLSVTTIPQDSLLVMNILNRMNGDSYNSVLTLR